MEKTKRKVKKSAPLRPWALFILKITQHLALCIVITGLIASVLLGSVYVEDYEHRYTLNISSDIEASKQAFAERNLYHMSVNLLRYVTIRSQLEVDGKFDGDKVINVSEYAYRKANDFTNTKRPYFKEANFRLEDLLKWQQAGAIPYLETLLANQETPVVTKNEMARTLEKEFVGYYNYSVGEFKYPFASVDGVELQYMIVTVEEYKELLRQLIDCMYDLAYNYNDYIELSKEFSRPDTNFVYFVEMNNENNDVFTNVLYKPYESYFEHIDYSAKVNTYFSDNYGYDEVFDFVFNDLENPNNPYEYAFGDDATIYLGYDLNRGEGDGFATVCKAYDNLNLEKIYTTLAIVIAAALCYLIIFFYMMYATGRKQEEDGTDYIELNWLDAIPLELYLVWCGLLGLGAAALGILGWEAIGNYTKTSIPQGILSLISLGAVVVSVVTMETLYSLSRRCKAHVLFKNSFIYKYVFVLFKRFFQYLNKIRKRFVNKVQHYVIHSGQFERTWGVFMLEVVFSLVTVAIVWIMAARGDEQAAMLVAIVYVLVMVVVCYRRMVRKEERMDIVEKMEEIIAGEEARVETEGLSSENAALGNAVNEIGEGIQNAVQISTRDERLKAELLTNVSHDIKTPLTSIITYVDLLKKEDLHNEKAKEYLEVLENKSYKLKNLIQDLIEVSKISTGNIEYEMVPLNVHELMLQATGEYEERFREKCLKLVYSNDVTDTLIMADSRRIWRVMENLFSNVYKYALEGTRVYIEVEQADGKLCISIKNISAKELSVKAEDLTERFVRGDASRTTEGSGLGLAIAKNLVVGQGGQFHIASDGDLFKVKLSFKVHQP